MKFKRKEKNGLKKLKRIPSTTALLWRYVALFTVGLLSVTFLVCYGVLGNAFFAQAKKRVKDVGEELHAAILEGDFSADQVEKLLGNYAVTSGVITVLTDQSGAPIAPDSFLSLPDWQRLVSDVDSQLGEWQEDKVKIYNSGGREHATVKYVARLRFGGEKCTLLVCYPLSTMTKAVKQMQIYVLVIAAVAIVATFVLSYFIAEKLSRPLKNTCVTTSKLAKGDFSVEFTSAEYDEIATLSSGLNYMKDELKKSGEFQKELLANVSHDLKTPLTMIKAYALMIREISGDDPVKRDKNLQVIIDESDRLTGLVEDVLSASKISSGLAQLNKKVFNLTEYLYGVINKFSYLQETKGYSIMVDVDANLYTAADEEKIGQVFYNLISNAVNYTGDDKTIFISLKQPLGENYIRFSVRDTGKGISDEELAHIWDRYYRSKDSHNRPVKGTGLGLNIVKAILDAHAFKYGVNSQSGRGSVFFVDFPVIE